MCLCNLKLNNAFKKLLKLANFEVKLRWHKI